ncbi:MAG TPA: tryptophan 2,3-dioxygenase family protein [Flavitalea sp.]|nr:tryptophan 2,3-dioxygenase family protein [Flavitalea sp.]
MSGQGVHYGDYLRLEQILGAQFPESERLGELAHDEMLFIVIHQAYELWFRQVLHEVESVNTIMAQPALNDNSPELQTVVHRLSRVVTILKVLVHQVDIMETMTPMDFLEFRDLLRPASGFQSWQFKIIEARLGLTFESRHGQEYYLSQLREAQVKMIRDAETKQTLLQLVNSWLERMPFFDEVELWQNYQPVYHTGISDVHVFWNDYRQVYNSSLSPVESGNAAAFDKSIINDGIGKLSVKACRAALFIMLYRGYPVLQLPFQLINNLLEIDEQLSTWRYRHMNMVHRMIGTRVGTGGSTGKEYLRGAVEKHFIFSDFASLTSFLIDRRKLPVLSRQMERRLGFNNMSPLRG